MGISRQGFGAGVFYVLIANFGWSLSGLFVRLINSSDADRLTGWQINCWRGFWMAVALLCYAVLRYGADTPKIFNSIPRFAMFLSALCFAAGTTFYVTSLTLVPTATVSVIGAMSPLFAGLLSRWVTGERPSVYAWVAALVGIAGTVVIAWNGIQTGQLSGLLLCFGVPLTFAAQTLLLRRYRAYDMMPAICVGGVLSFLIAGTVSMFSFAGGSAFNIDFHDFFLLMLMGPVQLAIPLVFYGLGAKTVQGVTLALLAMMDAVINPYWTWLFAGEIPEESSIIGGAIIIVAVVLSVVGQAWQNRRETVVA
jgi:drug/metabolite transporter, DME family